jgi:hypothetical protein
MLGHDAYIEALADSADRYKCPVCHAGIEDDECDAEQFRRSGEKMLTQEQMKAEWDALGYPTGFSGILFNYGRAIESLANQEKDKRIEELKNTISGLEEDGKFICCGNFDKCSQACTPRGEHIAKKALQSSQSQVSDEVLAKVLFHRFEAGDYEIYDIEQFPYGNPDCSTCVQAVIVRRDWNALQSSTPTDKKGGE